MYKHRRIFRFPMFKSKFFFNTIDEKHNNPFLWQPVPLRASCFPSPLSILNLNSSLSFCCQSGSYRSYLVHEDLVVTERIDDIKPLGFYIRRLCDGKETYRMQRRSSLQGVDSLHAYTRRRGRLSGQSAAWSLFLKKQRQRESLKCRNAGCETSLFAAYLEY